VKATALDLPFRVVMVKIKALDLVNRSLVTNIIKSSKTGTFNVANTVIGYQKMFFPSHINKITFKWIICEIIIVKFGNEGFKRRKLSLYNSMSNKLFDFLFKLTQCKASMYCCACHFLVKKEYRGPMISPSKNVYFID
jgi:hypothetical protein